MLQKLTEYLQQKDWSYSSKDDGTIRLALTGDRGTYHSVIYVKKDTNILAVVTHLGTHCPIDRFDKILNLINFANNTILYGNFEINTSGDIKFRTSINISNIELTDGVIDDLIFMNVQNIDFAQPTFSRMMFGDITNDDAYYALFPHLKNENDKIEDAKIEDISFE